MFKKDDIWPVLFKYLMFKGFNFIVSLTIVTLILITMFRPHTAGLHQAIVSVY